MSEYTPAVIAGNAPVNAPEGLTPEGIEAVLADFRAWLQQAAAAGTAPPPDGLPEEPEPIDLHTLLGNFIAVRHEVNLQTRAVRGQQEQNAQALARLSEALAALERSQAARDQARQEDEQDRLRPLLKTLVDLYDVLGLAAREVPRTLEALRPLLDSLAAAQEPEPPPPPAPAPVARRSFWARLFAGGRPAEHFSSPPEGEGSVTTPVPSPPGGEGGVRRMQAREAAERIGRLFESFLTGYTMSLERLDRALRQHGLEPIPCVGAPFDPERMEVVAAVSDSGRPPGEVLEEVRRGYLWQGRVFRYAQVSVAR